MNDAPIFIYDSGLGGLSVLAKVINIVPKERFVYFGDNGNAPYGSRTDDDLFSIVKKNCGFIKMYKPKLIVAACNTLSVDFLPYIEEFTGVKSFGVFPPISKRGYPGRKVLLLATERTCAKYGGIAGLDLAPLRSLAGDIEKNAFNLEAVDIDEHLKNCGSGFKDEKNYYDEIILGCTHYFFVKNKILNHFCPQKITDGGDFTAKMVSEYLEKQKSSVNNRGFSLKFVGKSATFNRKFYFSVVRNL